MRGARNLNPWNIKDVSPETRPDPWIGQTGRDAQMHAQFADVAFAVRALLRLLWTYGRRYKLTTLNAIMSRWSPSSDTLGSLPGMPANNPNAAARFIATKLGIDPNQTLDLYDTDGRVQPRMRDRFIDGMAAAAEVENCPDLVYDRATYLRGFALYEYHRKNGNKA